MTEAGLPDDGGAHRSPPAPAAEPPGGWIARTPLRAVAWAEDAIHIAVAALLVVVGVVVLMETVVGSATGDEAFVDRITAVVNGVLVVIIVMEILRTVVAHFEQGGFQLKPFLIIGIISAVRHILLVGAKVSLKSKDATAFRKTQIELGVNAAVVLALVVGLILIRRNEAQYGDTESND